MKLLICIHCRDILRLTRARATCGCGAAWANLIDFDDANNHVATNANTLIIGIDDQQLTDTLYRKAADPKHSQRVPAYLLPEPCKAVHRVEGPRIEQPTKASAQGRSSTKRAAIPLSTRLGEQTDTQAGVCIS